MAATTSGRAGKTTAATLKWHQVRLAKRGQISVFVALTREHAKKIVWAELKRQNQKWGLGLRFNEAELVVHDPFGGTLYLLGANREDLVDTLRGIPFVLVLFDEAAFFRRGLLERCVEDAIHIRLFDYGGQCWLMSTPGLTNAGWFFKVSTGKIPGWSRHHWTLMDNPHLPKHMGLSPQKERDLFKARWIQEQKTKRGWTDISPSFMREFLGLWAADPDAQVYPISEANIISTMPLEWTTDPASWYTVLGIDYGVVKATAHALLAWHPRSRAVFVVRSRRDNNISPSEAAAVTQRWVNDYSPTAIIGDTGGLGKGFAAEAAYRFQLPIEGANKLDKRGHQEWVRDALEARPARLFLVEPENLELIQEMEQLQWEPFPKEDPRYRQKEDPRGRKDLADALLYGYVKCYSQFPTEPEMPQYGGDPNPMDRKNEDDWTQYTH